MSNFSLVLLWFGVFSGGFVKVKQNKKTDNPVINEKNIED